jgi:hypothetical protein
MLNRKPENREKKAENGKKKPKKWSFGETENGAWEKS